MEQPFEKLDKYRFLARIGARREAVEVEEHVSHQEL